MRNLLFLFCCLCFTSELHAKKEAKVSLEEVFGVKKQKEILILEQKRLLKESLRLKKIIEKLSLLSEEKRKNLANHQEEILKILPLLARLERANPFRMMVDSTTGQHRIRGVILIRFLLSSIKHKIQDIQTALNEMTVMANDLEIKSQANRQLLEEIEVKRTQLSAVENKKIEEWMKAELERLAEEEDVKTLLEESHATLSKTISAAKAATTLKGLPFRRLEQPVGGKIYKDSTLQSKFSPHTQGIFFEAQKNAQVCAPAKGKIVFRGPFRNQAEILIIDHGEQVHTILMGIHKIDAEIGKNVYIGEKLGTMAGYGAGSQILYLELRHKGKSIDPAPYFAIRHLE